jgi:hypothetical protein
MLPVLFETGPSAHTALFHYRDDCPGHCASPNATHVRVEIPPAHLPRDRQTDRQTDTQIQTAMEFQ